jgi:acyl-homoserine lactone acylase PvdQ
LYNSVLESKSVLAVDIFMTTLGAPAILTVQEIYAAGGNHQGGSKSVLVGENDYVAWFSNKSGN